MMTGHAQFPLFRLLMLALLPLAVRGVDYPANGLVLHLDAGSISGVADQALLSSGWVDQSASGVTAFSGTPPMYIADAGGGYPAVRFEGTGQYLQAAIPTGGDVSVFIVFSYRRLLSGWPNYPYRETLLAAAGADPALLLSSREPYTASPPSPDYPSFKAKQVSGVTVKTWVDGRDTADATGDIVNGRFYVGSAVYKNLPASNALFISSTDANGTNAGKHEIREILVYNRALSDDERGLVQRYLGDKYDIEVVWRPLSYAVENYPHVLGSQQFNDQYSFGQSHIPVLDYARATFRQGSRVVKFRLNPKKYVTEDGFTAVTGINSLTKLVRDQPEVKAILDLPMTDYLFWMSTYNYTDWPSNLDPNKQNADGTVGGLSQAAIDGTYTEVYNLVVYLLTTYSGTGKRFYLGNWEGDWTLAGGLTDPTQIPQYRIRGMIDWANIRQKAVDDAKAATPYSNVNVWYYVEMNKADWMRQDLPCVANSVIPAMPKLDMISISSYTVHKDSSGNLAPTTRIYSDLNRIKALLDAKPDATIPGSRIIIGEYGWTYDAAKYGSLQGFAQQHLNTARAFLGWQGGTLRFILQWQFYNHFDAGGADVKEMSQIDFNNNFSPLYYMHENFYRAMRRWVDDYRQRNGTVPGARAYADQAYYLLGTLPVVKYTPTISFANYPAWQSYHFMDATEFANAAVSGPTADPYGTGVSNLLRYGLAMGKFDVDADRMPAVRTQANYPVFAIPYNASKTDLRWVVQATSSLGSWPYTVYDSAASNLTATNGWLEVSAGGVIPAGSPVFYRLQLQRGP